MLNRGLFTSARQTWRTPKAVYETLDREFSFDCDPCPSNPTFDGLEISWGRSSYVNPPYRESVKWVTNGLREWRKGKTVVFLLPARTDTRLFHDLILPNATEIRFLRGRLHFDERGPAPFPSMIVIFDHRRMEGRGSTTSRLVGGLATEEAQDAQKRSPLQ